MKKWFPISLAIISLILDQVTKKIVVLNLNKHEIKTIIDDFFRIIYVENPGMAFGLFKSISNPYKDIIFTSMTVFAIAIVIYYYKIVNKEKILVKSSIALILGGALGNLFDKTLGYIIFEEKLQIIGINPQGEKGLYGTVVDFIDIGFGTIRWFTFNVADISITIGVFILLFYMIINKNDQDIFLSNKL